MAQSVGSTSIEYNNEIGVVCYCKWPAKIVKAWTDENPGRRFYTCRGRKAGNGYESCQFFRWFDVEKPHGWQHVALLEARDVIRDQKEELKNLRNVVSAVTVEAESSEMKLPNEEIEELKQVREKCEELKREAMVLAERSKVYRNVLITSSVGFTVVIGILVEMWK